VAAGDEKTRARITLFGIVSDISMLGGKECDVEQDFVVASSIPAKDIVLGSQDSFSP
jgi:hypothetical protein